MSLKKEFGEGEEKATKAAELRKMEQEGRIIEKFVQEFKRVARGSGYKGRPMEGRRMECSRGRIKEINDYTNNLKGVENLELLDQILRINTVYQLQ